MRIVQNIQNEKSLALPNIVQCQRYHYEPQYVVLWERKNTTHVWGKRYLRHSFFFYPRPMRRLWRSLLSAWTVFAVVLNIIGGSVLAPIATADDTPAVTTAETGSRHIYLPQALPPTLFPMKKEPIFWRWIMPRKYRWGIFPRRVKLMRTRWRIFSANRWKFRATLWEFIKDTSENTEESNDSSSEAGTSSGGSSKNLSQLMERIWSADKLHSRLWGRCSMCNNECDVTSYSLTCGVKHIILPA